MVKPFLQVDLSNEARDFESVALEPGLLLLEHDAQVRKALGRLVARPTRQHDAQRNRDYVEYCLCDEQGAFLYEAECLPATAIYIKRDAELTKDLAELQQRVDKIERDDIREAMRNHLDALCSQGVAHQGCYFFRYRHANKWRLVWCWGYQRKDGEPADPIICTNAECSLLFVRRSDGKGKCPRCDIAPTPPPRPTKRKRLALAGLAASLLLVAGLVIYYIIPPPPVPKTEFVTVPAEWTGPVGAAVEFAVIRRDLLDEEVESEEDLTDRAVAISENPKVIGVNKGGTRAFARAPGKTALHFYVGDEEVHATVTVEPAKSPDKIVLEPDQIMLGVGATSQLRAIGHYANGKPVDLTQAVQWLPVEGSAVFGYHGAIEAVAVGTATVRAKYRSTPDDPEREAEATVEVKDAKYESLKVALDRDKLEVDQTAEISVSAVDGTGKQDSTLNSSLLNLQVVPPDIARIDDGIVHAIKAGKASLMAEFRGLEAFVEFNVEPASGPARFEVTPKDLRLAVDETAELSIVAAGSDPIRLESSAPEIAEILDGHRVVGRAPGEAKITAVQEARQEEIRVEVVRQAIETISITPEPITVPVDGAVPVRVVGRCRNGDEVELVELAADQLTSERLPAPSVVEFDLPTLTLRGQRPTAGSPQSLTLRYGDLKATATIHVIPPPLRLELTPAGDNPLPKGQSLLLQAWANYGGGRRVELPPERIRWTPDPENLTGLTFEPYTGYVRAEEAGAGPITIKATYQGQTSNSVSIKSVAATPVDLVLEAEPPTVRVGQAGRLRLAATDSTDSSRSVTLLPSNVTFGSPDENILAINPKSGTYRGVAEGEVEVTAHHPAAGTPATVTIRVEPQRKPESVRIASDLGKSVTIPLGAEFDAYRVTADYSDQETRDVTGQALLTFEPDDPRTAPVSVVGHRLKAMQTGLVVVKAKYGGVQSSEGLTVHVDANVVPAEIELYPEPIELAKGETATLRAIGFLNEDGKKTSIGDISSLGDLTWESSDKDVLQVDGPSITGLRIGKAKVTVTVKKGTATGTANVSVVPAAQAAVQKIEVLPETLRLLVGESKSIGTDVTVTCGGVDFSGQAEFTSSRPSIVRVDDASNSIVGVSPGEARLAVTYGPMLITVPVTVEPREASQERGTVNLEPSTGTLAVGETQDLRVFLVTPSGEKIDRTSSATLVSSDPTILSIQGNRIIGQMVGDAQVAALLSDGDQPGRGSFAVSAQMFDRLVILPPQLSMALGEEARCQIFGMSKEGRRELSDHPELEVTVPADNNNVAQMAGTSLVRAVGPGNATIRATWRGSLSAEAVVTVTDKPWSDLRIEPVNATIEVGQQQSYMVYARRGTKERAVTGDDGLELAIGDPSVARFDDDLTVVGTAPGTTNTTAKLASQRAEAQLTVTGPPAGGPGRLDDAPRPKPVGLRFIPDVLTLQLGTPGTSVRVVEVSPDGQEEDVDHRVDMQFDGPDDVAEMEQTASGPVFRAAKLGRTRVAASYDDGNRHLETRRPLLIQVVDPPENIRLDVRPNPVTMSIGETAEFRRVQIVSDRGTSPVDVDYSIVPNDPCVAVENSGRTMRGVAGGQTQVRVVPVGVDPKFSRLDATVSVRVLAPDENGEAKLVLSGPTQTTVGAEATFRVELITGDASKDVTHEATTLVLDRNQVDLARVQPGCVLVSEKPGTVNLRAQHKDLISNPLQLRIDPVANRFESLELEIDSRRLTVGESRQYKLWGHPAGGGPRQDLTNSIVSDPQDASKPRVALQVTDNPGNGEVVLHNPPTLVGKSPGSFVIAAALGDLRSDVVNIDVIEAGQDEMWLAAEPQTLSVRRGKQTPELVITARRSGAHAVRVDANLESLNLDILAPVEGNPGRFEAKQCGETQIRAEFGGQETLVTVKVTGNVIDNVELSEEVDLVGDNKFAVNVRVTGDATGSEMQYRVVSAGNPSEGGWKAATIADDQVAITLKSPTMLIGPKDAVYHLVIEARDGETGPIERYPCSFSVQIGLRLKLKPAARK